MYGEDCDKSNKIIQLVQAVHYYVFPGLRIGITDLKIRLIKITHQNMFTPQKKNIYILPLRSLFSALINGTVP